MNRAEIFLILATVFWGATFPVIKMGLNYIEVEYLLFIRFLIASLTLHFLYKIFRIEILLNKNVIVIGILLGFIGFLSYFFQTLGLKYTTPARSAFITQLLIVFVFIFQFFFLKKKIFKLQWFSLIFILLGSYFMFLLSEYGNTSSTILKGDVYTFVSAFFFGLYIILIDKFALESKVLLGVILLHFYTIVILSGVLIIQLQNELPVITQSSFWAIMYLSIPATLISLGIMFYYQPKATPVAATIIYSLEPVFATIFSILFLDSIITNFEFLGGFLILCGSIMGGINSQEK